MKAYLSLVLSLVYFVAFSQERKTYNGPIGSLSKGQATYQYYENEDFERVLDGPYTFSSEWTKATGTFVKGKKHGIWKFTYLVLSHALPVSNTGYCNDVFTMSYKNGKRDGPASYTRTLQSSGKVLIKSLASFKDNYQVGDYIYENISQSKNISAHFDSDGFIDGNCIMQAKYDTGLFKDIIEFKSGILVSRLYRNINQGDVIINVKPSALPQAFTDNFNPRTGISAVEKVEIHDSYPIVNDVRFSKDQTTHSQAYAGKGNTYLCTEQLKGDISPFSLPTGPGYPDTLNEEMNFWKSGCPFEVEPARNNSVSYTTGVDTFEFLPVISLRVAISGVDY